MRRETGESRTGAVWFLHSTSGEPLGQLSRGGAETVPEAGLRLAQGEVVSWTELRSSCAMRRFRVVVRTGG